MNENTHTVLGAIQLIGIVLMWAIAEVFLLTVFKWVAGIGGCFYAFNQISIFNKTILKPAIKRYKAKRNARNKRLS